MSIPAERALTRLTALLADLGLEPKPAKTRIVHLMDGGEGFDFLGFHHRLVRARGHTGGRRFVFLARWPSRRAAQHARDRLRELTGRARLLVPVEEVVGSLNRFLRGWAVFFRIGNSARCLDKIRRYAFECLAIFVANLIGGTGGGGCTTSATLPAISAWSAFTGPSSLPSPTMPGGPSLPNTAGEGRR